MITTEFLRYRNLAIDTLDIQTGHYHNHWAKRQWENHISQDSVQEFLCQTQVLS